MTQYFYHQWSLLLVLLTLPLAAMSRDYTVVTNHYYEGGVAPDHHYQCRVTIPVSISRTSGTAYCFEFDNIYIGFQDYHIHGRQGEAEIVGLNGKKTVGTRPGEPSHASWTYVLSIPSGSREGQVQSIDFYGCGSWTHWVYEWHPASKE